MDLVILGKKNAILYILFEDSLVWELSRDKMRPFQATETEDRIPSHLNKLQNIQKRSNIIMKAKEDGR